MSRYGDGTRLWLRIFHRGLSYNPPLRAPFPSLRVNGPFRAADDRMVAVPVTERCSKRVENLLLDERRDALKRIGILTHVMPREDASIRDGVVRNRSIEEEMRKSGRVAIPLVGDSTRE